MYVSAPGAMRLEPDGKNILRLHYRSIFMARRTKQDALVTRDGIIDAAELLFERQGVSRTTLQHIAVEAGVTRGAIYWHFRDKSDLFKAIAQDADGREADDPVGDVRSWLLTVLRLTASDPKTRRVFEIATHKIEYVDELVAVRDRHFQNYSHWLMRTEKRIKLAIRRGLLNPEVSARVAALGLWAAVDGLIQIWLLNPQAFSLVRVGRQVIDAHLDAMRTTAQQR